MIIIIVQLLLFKIFIHHLLIKFAETIYVMTFSEALKHKKEILKNSSDFTKTLYDYIVIPAIEEEAEKYINDFSKSPATYNDLNSKAYSSNSQFKVFLFAKNKT